MLYLCSLATCGNVHVQHIFRAGFSWLWEKHLHDLPWMFWDFLPSNKNSSMPVLPLVLVFSILTPRFPKQGEWCFIMNVFQHLYLCGMLKKERFLQKRGRDMLVMLTWWLINTLNIHCYFPRVSVPVWWYAQCFQLLWNVSRSIPLLLYTICIMSNATKIRESKQRQNWADLSRMTAAILFCIPACDDDAPGTSRNISSCM